MARGIGEETRIAIGGPLGVELEIAAERAASLGRAGRRVEETLAALVAFDAAHGVGGGSTGEPGGEGASAHAPPLPPPAAAERAHLVAAAAEAVWAYFVQREAMGLRRHDDAIADYGIPREVLIRIGAG